jgi:putative CRISPR-associated protein (TIGR02620 family)
VVVTRHKALVALLVERGIIDAAASVIEHASPANVAGKHVIGVLPLSLAALAASITEIPLALTAEDRGQELSLDRLRQIAGAPARYVVQKVF